MIKTRTDVAIVAGQLGSWTLILLLSNFEYVLTTTYLKVILGVGISLTIVGALTLGAKTYSSSTKPRVTNVMTQRALYRYIRHPIYLGLLIAGMAFLLSKPTIQAGLAYFLLMLFTNIRADLEEGMLEEKYPEYTNYKKSTKRYIPFIY